MAEIDILIAVDTDSLIQQGLSQDSNSPTNVGDNYIYAIVRSDEAISGQAGAELNVAAETMDIIRWRMTSLTLNASYDTIPYKFVVSRGPDLVKDNGPEIVTVSTPLPNPDDLLHPGRQSVQSFFWQADVKKPGNATYHFQFMILDRHGKVKGYCTWDPFITITD
jgi:nematocidal protein AidA